MDKKENNYLQMTCTGPASNPFAIGTTVRIYYNNQQQYFLMTPLRGIFSSVEVVLFKYYWECMNCGKKTDIGVWDNFGRSYGD